jgi:hypothetical protein
MLGKSASSPRKSLSLTVGHTATKIPFMYSQKRNCGGLSLNFHIHVSVSDLYIPRIGPQILLQQNSQTNCGNIYISHRNVNVEIETDAKQFLFWEYLFRIFGIVSLQCTALLTIFDECIKKKKINQALPKHHLKIFAKQNYNLLSGIAISYQQREQYLSNLMEDNLLLPFL